MFHRPKNLGCLKLLTIAKLIYSPLFCEIWHKISGNSESAQVSGVFLMYFDPNNSNRKRFSCPGLTVAEIQNMEGKILSFKE